MSFPDRKDCGNMELRYLEETWLSETRRQGSLSGLIRIGTFASCRYADQLQVKRDLFGLFHALELIVDRNL